MRKTNTTINPALSRVISETGHTDLLVVTDAGLPIPPGSERIDLAYRPGAPAFFDVLDTVLAELVVEGGDGLGRGRRAQPARARRAARASARHRDRAGAARRVQGAHPWGACLRALGRVHPYANVILQAGVAY